MHRSEALEVLLEVASEQAGYVSGGQAFRLGVTSSDLDRLVRSGDLRRVRHGVYAMRHAQPTHEAEIAAWLTLERGRLPWERRDDLDLVFSHDSAAARFNLGTIIPIYPTLTLRVDTPRYSKASDITIHRAPLRPADWTWYQSDGLTLPVTTPARTIVDLILDKHEPSYISRALAEALGDGMLTAEQLLDAAEHRKSRTAGLVARAAALLDSAA